MRLDTVKREVSSSGTMQVAKATIKATPKIFDMFANDTYANKPLAIMRELVANGIDAHRAAGRPNRPVEVQLPTSLDPTCRIRDFGTGMHHDFVMGPYMAYTDGSTKDKSDEAIGGFGIGSKSPFSYVDQYTLRVVHEGILSVYTMFKDTDGIPAVGLQAQTTTDEPNGVEVSFPVEENDIETFHAAAQEALQYFLPLPLVENGKLNAPDYTYVGTNWALRPSAGELGIIMGGVRYPAQQSSMEYSLKYDGRLSPLLQYGIDLTLPIGACGVAMSREQLSYTGKTSTSIKEALNAVIDDVVSTFAHLFDKAPSEWDAMIMLGKEAGEGRSTARSNLLLANAKYKGVKLEQVFRIEPADFKNVGFNHAGDVRGWMVEPKSRRRGVNCPAPQWKGMIELYGIHPSQIEQVIIDDLPQNAKSKTVCKLRAFISDQPQQRATLVLRGRDEKDVAKLLKLIRNPSDYVLTSTLPEPTAAPKGAKTVRPRVRMFTFTGGRDRFTHSKINNLSPASSKRDIVKEVPYVDQPATGIMVVMNSFDLPQQFYARMNSGLMTYDELSFVNEGDAPKLKNSFANFDDVFADRLKAALAKHPDLSACLALRDNKYLGAYLNEFEAIQHDGRFDDLTTAAQTRPFGQLFTAWRKYVRNITPAQIALTPFFKASLPSGIDPKRLAERIDTDVKILLAVLDLDKETHRTLLFKNL